MLADQLDDDIPTLEIALAREILDDVGITTVLEPGKNTIRRAITRSSGIQSSFQRLSIANLCLSEGFIPLINKSQLVGTCNEISDGHHIIAALCEFDIKDILAISTGERPPLRGRDNRIIACTGIHGSLAAQGDGIVTGTGLHGQPQLAVSCDMCGLDIQVASSGRAIDEVNRTAISAIGTIGTIGTSKGQSQILAAGDGQGLQRIICYLQCIIVITRSCRFYSQIFDAIDGKLCSSRRHQQFRSGSR